MMHNDVNDMPETGEIKNRFHSPWWLLPYPFKIIGFIIVLIVFVLSITDSVLGWKWLAVMEKLPKSVIYGVLLSGALLVMFSKEKIESVQVASRRQIAYVIAAIVLPVGLLVDFVGKGKFVAGITVWIALRTFFLWYFFVFYFLSATEKFSSKKSENEFSEK